MDREKFKAGMESDIWFSFKQSNKMTAEIAKTQSKETNMIWLVEESAELQQALLKNIRGFDNWCDVLQELADVEIGMQVLGYPDEDGITLVTENEINKAIDVKLDRDYKRIKANHDTT